MSKISEDMHKIYEIMVDLKNLNNQLLCAYVKLVQLEDSLQGDDEKLELLAKIYEIRTTLEKSLK